jgi:hypothetical protein
MAFARACGCLYWARVAHICDTANVIKLTHIDLPILNQYYRPATILTSSSQELAGASARQLAD